MTTWHFGWEGKPPETEILGMKKLLCKILGHWWKYLPKSNDRSKKRVCRRCGRVEKRIEFIPKFPFPEEKWIGIG